MIENMKVRRFKEEDAQEVRNLIVRNFLEVNSKDYGISAMEKLAKAYNAEKVLNVATDEVTQVAWMNREQIKELFDANMFVDTLEYFFTEVDK